MSGDKENQAHTADVIARIATDRQDIVGETYCLELKKPDRQ